MKPQMVKRAALALAAAFLFASRPSGADATCATAPDTQCDLQPGSTTLRAELWSGSCDASGFASRLRAREYPISGDVNATLIDGVRAPSHWLNGVCEFKRPGGDVDRAIAELEEAQSNSLFASQREVAKLFEGLAHCRKLEALWSSAQAALQSPEASSTLPVQLFCEHRRAARATLDAVDFSDLDVRYVGVGGDTSSVPSVFDDADAVGACAAQFLDSSRDALCRIVTPPSLSTVDSLAETAANEVLTQLFGDSTRPPDATTPVSVSPIQALLAKRVMLVDSATADADARISSLLGLQQVTTRAVRSLAAPFCSAPGNCAGPIPTAVQTNYDLYRSAVLDARDVLATVNQWLDGLFLDADGRDMRKEVRDKQLLLSSAASRLLQPTTVEQQLDTVQSALAGLSTATASNTATKSLCALYFCEMRSRAPATFTRTCQSMDLLVPKQVGAINHLCELDPSKAYFREGAAATSNARTLCTSVGFPTALSAGIKSSDVEACMGAQYVIK
jgi:hypothetical protein